MIDGRDIYASANVMIRRFGKDAKIEAARRADERLDTGDLGSQAVLDAAHQSDRGIAQHGEAG